MQLFFVFFVFLSWTFQLEQGFLCGVFRQELENKITHYTVYLKDSGSIAIYSKTDGDTKNKLLRTSKQSGAVLNVLSLDLYQNGQSGVLLAVQKTGKIVYIYFPYIGSSSQDEKELFQSDSQVLVYTDRNTGEPCFLGMKDNSLCVWKKTQTGIFKPTPPPFLETEDRVFQLAQEHMSAFVDLNGDCIPDLFLVCRDNDTGSLTGEIFISQNEGFVYQPEKKLVFPKGTNSVMFHDLHGHGSQSLIFSCNPDHEPSYFSVVPNRLPEIEVGLFYDTREKKLPNLCTPSDIFGFVLEREQKQHLSQLVSEKEGVSLELAVRDANNPLFIIPHDLAQTGLAGLLVPVKIQGGKPFFVFLQTLQTESGLAFEHKKDLGLEDTTDVFNLVVYDPEQRTSPSLVLNYYENGVLNNKVIAPSKNGRMYGMHILGFTTAPERGKRSLIKNSNHIGLVFTYVAGVEGRAAKVRTISQGVQSMSFLLSGEGCYIGLGAFSTFIEKFTCCVPENTLSVTQAGGILPNTNLFVYSTPDGLSLFLKLYPAPYYSVMIFSMFCSILVFLLLSRILYNCTEAKEDHLERRQALHLINYDAL